jgi:hypothetical protein
MLVERTSAKALNRLRDSLQRGGLGGEHYPQGGRDVAGEVPCLEDRGRQPQPRQEYRECFP